MKYKTLFRLVIKAVGVWFCAQGIVDFTQGVVQTLVALERGLPGYMYSWIWIASGAVQFGIGLYLFFGGKWVVNMAIPSNRPYCPECAYDLSGAVSDRCPECGTVLNQELLRSSNDHPE